MNTMLSLDLIFQLQSDLLVDKTNLEKLEAEKSSLNSTLRSLEVELASLENTYEELQPKFESRLGTITQEHNRLTTEKTLLSSKFQAIRLICTKDYIQSPEVGVIRFLARKPSPDSTITEIRSALGIDQNTLNRVVSGLAARKVLEYNESVGAISLLVKIDLFNEEV